MFDKLSEVHSAARARAVEDFTYFHQHVYPTRDITIALRVWDCVLKQELVPAEVRVSETFEWLFPELVARRAA